MLTEKLKRDAFHDRLKKEKDMLSKVHLITPGNDLKDAWVVIDKKNISKSKKREKSWYF